MAMDDAKQCVAVIGAGSFGTAVAWMLRQAGHDPFFVSHFLQLLVLVMVLGGPGASRRKDEKPIGARIRRVYGPWKAFVAHHFGARILK